MRLFSNQVKEQFAELLRLNQGNQKIYLVGGVVRDLVLGQENKDVDILCEKDTRAIAKRWAETKMGAFYVLDEERSTCRVITTEAGSKLVYDFASQQGSTLFDDLSVRDFTINAMAVDFDSPEVVIDPLNGTRDLQQGILRACSSTSFSSDPVRVIRAIRYASAYQLKIEPITFELLKSSVTRLKDISNERKRDELFKILDLQDPFTAVELLQGTGILAELGLSEIYLNSAQSGRNLVYLLDSIIGQQGKLSPNPLSGLLIGIAKYFPYYMKLLVQKNTSDRNLRQLLLFASIVNGLDSSKLRLKAQKLMLSNEEVERLAIVAEHLRDLDKLVEHVNDLTDRELYLFFNKVDIVGLDIGIMALANQFTFLTGPNREEKLINYSLVVEKLFSCWIERQPIIKPTPWLNGKDLMMNFDLPPGPNIGKLLDKLKEEQAAGEILTREQAMCWMEEQVSILVDEKRWNQDKAK